MLTCTAICVFFVSFYFATLFDSDYYIWFFVATVRFILCLMFCCAGFLLFKFFYLLYLFNSFICCAVRIFAVKLNVFFSFFFVSLKFINLRCVNDMRTILNVIVLRVWFSTLKTSKKKSAVHWKCTCVCVYRSSIEQMVKISGKIWIRRI